MPGSFSPRSSRPPRLRSRLHPDRARAYNERRLEVQARSGLERRRHLALIGRLSGRLLEKDPSEIIVDAGGVGYRVAVPLTTFGRLPAAGETVILSIHTHVREDALSL